MRDMSSDNVRPMGMPTETGISRLIFSVASSISKITPLYDPTYRVPFPADTIGFDVGRVWPWIPGAMIARATRTAASERRERAARTERGSRGPARERVGGSAGAKPPGSSDLREDDIDLPPVLLRGGALLG